MILATRATAEEPAAAPPDLRARAASIFQYDEPQDAHRVRATLEIGAGLAYQFLVYLSYPSPTAVESEQLYYPSDKLLHGAWSFDGNTARTNFGGHPLAGAFFYLVARGNRMGSLESAFATAAGSTLWEITEYHEKASINDEVVTPLGGVSIGEALVQLSAFFEQRDAGKGDRALAWVLQPFKKGHDLWDGAKVARRPEALAWHDFRFDIEAGAALREGAWSPEAGLRFSAALVRGAGFGEPGRGTTTLRDANAVRVGAGLAAGRDGITRARFESDVTLVGLYARDLEGAAAPAGQDLLVGLGTGFEVVARRYARGDPADWRSLVQVPGVSATWRALGGAIPLELRARAAFTFGGVRSLVLAADPAAASPDDLPLVTRAYGYYYAWGWMAHLGVEASPGPLRLGGEVRLDALRGFVGHDAEPIPSGHPATLGDGRGEARGWARWSLGGALLGAEVTRAWAAGEVSAARRSAATTDLLLTLELRR